MPKSTLFWGGAVASGLLLTAVVAQETTRRPAAEGGASQGGRAAEAASDPASMKPIDHFLAGYYAGYSDGYLDGGEDTAVAAVERQQSLAAKHAADGQHSGEMQPGRREARESLRAHMLGEDEAQTAGQAAGQAAEGRADEGPEETVSGTVVGIKEVPIEGTQLVHRVVRLETEEGRRQVADLGPTDQTDKLDIKEGDQLRVQGAPVETPDVRIIAGHRIFKGDQEAHVHYPGLKVSDDPAGSGTPQPGADRRPE